MFLKKSTTTIRGKTYNNYKIVKSYREGGKVKHRILFPLGALTEEQAERLRLAVATLHHFWQEWGFADFFREDRWVEAMVLNRCLEPVTKIKEWLTETVLPAYRSPLLRDQSTGPEGVRSGGDWLVPAQR